MTEPISSEEREGLRAMIDEPHLYRGKHFARLAEKALHSLDRSEAALARVTDGSMEERVERALNHRNEWLETRGEAVLSEIRAAAAEA